MIVWVLHSWQMLPPVTVKQTYLASRRFMRQQKVQTLSSVAITGTQWEHEMERDFFSGLPWGTVADPAALLLQRKPLGMSNECNGI